MTDNTDFAQLAALQQAQRIAAIREQLTANGFAVVSVEYVAGRYVAWVDRLWHTEKAIRSHLLGTDIELCQYGMNTRRGPYMVVK